MTKGSILSDLTDLCGRLRSLNGPSVVDCNDVPHMPKVAFSIANQPFELTPEQDLATQFQGNATEEFKEEIVAHLANFAYDPFNYEYFRNLHIVDLFLDGLTEPSERMIEFSMGGIANCCVDPENAAIILKNGGIPLIISCLKSPVENTVLSSMAALYYLCSPETIDEILTGEVVQYMNIYSAAKETNVHFRSLAQAFLDKHVLSHA